MEKIRVNLNKTEDKSYGIIIKNGILQDVAKDLKESDIAHKYIIVTDSNVEPLYGEKLLLEFEKEGLNTDMISFSAGEKYKNRDTKESIENFMLERKFGRDSAVVALGGGVVGDMAGYVAATYMRGVPYVQVPTTLLACVDSSIGGKTAVDTKHGKNLIGAFHQPRKVYIDVDTLITLEEKEMKEGLAEVIKYGVIRDGELFAFLEENIKGVFLYNKRALVHIIKVGCKIKGQIVEQDERESGLRKILNFGHTIGHAVENLSGYELSHGEAISIGMIVEGRLAVAMKLLQNHELSRLTELMKKAGLPTEIPKGIEMSNIIEAMKLDKKSRSGKIEMALPKEIGCMAQVNGNYGLKVDESLIANVT